MNNVKKILVTDIDLDGEGCAVLFDLAFRCLFDTEIHHVGRDTKDRDSLLYDLMLKSSISEYTSVSIYITDLSVSKECAEKISEDLKRSKINIVLLDHHEQSDLVDESIHWANICTDGTECGTSMFYKYLVDNNCLNITDALDEFVKNVKDWDLHTFKKNKNNNAVDLNLYYKIAGANDFKNMAINAIKNDLNILESPNVEKCIEESKSKTKSIVDKALSLSHKIRINGYNVWVTAANSCASEIGEVLAEREDTDFAAIIMLSNGTIELRSSENGIIDVGKIAKENGGGGHPHASGFPIKEMPAILNDILQICM